VVLRLTQSGRFDPILYWLSLLPCQNYEMGCKFSSLLLTTYAVSTRNLTFNGNFSNKCCYSRLIFHIDLYPYWEYPLFCLLSISSYILNTFLANIYLFHILKRIHWCNSSRLQVQQWTSRIKWIGGIISIIASTTTIRALIFCCLASGI
jgi:hypothetical protein